MNKHAIQWKCHDEKERILEAYNKIGQCQMQHGRRKMHLEGECRHTV
jgi:hypothetical protein